MNVRIGIVGSAGTGKSSLGITLAEQLDLPFLQAKVITKEILERDRYDYASGVQVERFLAQGTRQDELLCRTVGTETTNTPGFVTDRTVIDLAAYAVAELHDSDPEKASDICEQCKTHAGIYTHVLLCPWGTQPLVDNRLRTLNPWYQFIIQSLGEAFMQGWGINYVVLEEVGTEERVREAIERLGLMRQE